MIVTWTTLRTRQPAAAAPWQPGGATWWQAGHSGSGRLEDPRPDGRWWSVLATWPSRLDAEPGPPSREDVDAWHVVLEPASLHGDAVLAGGARPFDGLPSSGQAVGVVGAVGIVTFAGVSPDAAREREFFRRFLHLGRGVGAAPGQLAAVLQAPGDGAVLTFSVWADAASALDWAYQQPQHAGAVARQRTHRLVDASGSLRCAVLSSSGTLGDLGDPLAGLTAGRRAHPPPAAPAPRPGR